MTSSSDSSESGRIAGVDYGTVRIGIAISDPSRTIASPFVNYDRNGLEADGVWFKKLVFEEEIKKFVVGLPIHLDGRESEKSAEAREFGKWLGDMTELPVEYFDERFSSVQAEQMLQLGNLSKKKRKERLDMLAAQIMLTAYLESNRRGEDSTENISD